MKERNWLPVRIHMELEIIMRKIQKYHWIMKLKTQRIYNINIEIWRQSWSSTDGYRYM